MVEVLVEEEQRNPFQGSGGGGDLREDLDAVGVLVDHALEAADLPFDPAKALLYRIPVGVVAVHQNLPAH
jgi:hypothetical protein